MDCVKMPGKIEPLATRQNSDGNLGGFGGAKDEFYMLRRFFQRFQQGVEGLAREHVHFVDNVYFESRPAGPDIDVLP